VTPNAFSPLPPGDLQLGLSLSLDRPALARRRFELAAQHL